MTRAGVTYVAMAAAGISAAVLGYGVIWSYGEPEAPPVAMLAPPAPEPQNPIPPCVCPSDATAQPRTEALPNPVAAAPPPPPSAPPTTTPSPSETASGPVPAPLLAPQQESAREATAPTSPPRAADVTPPDRKIEKPQAATAPMDTQTAASVTRTVAPPKTKSSAALTSADRPQAASRPLKPPAQEAAKTEIAEPSPRPAEKPVVAQPLLEPAVAAPRESAAAASQPQKATKYTESLPAVTPTQKAVVAQPSLPPATSPREVSAVELLAKPATPPKEAVAQPPLPPTEPASLQPSSASKLAAAVPASSADSSALTPASPERAVDPRPSQVRAPAPSKESSAARSHLHCRYCHRRRHLRSWRVRRPSHLWLRQRARLPLRLQPRDLKNPRLLSRFRRRPNGPRRRRRGNLFILRPPRRTIRQSRSFAAANGH